MACWHYHRVPAYEDELHIVSKCPLYNKERAELVESISIASIPTNYPQLLQLLAGEHTGDMQSMARFLARARQTRRKAKCLFESMQHRMETELFSVRRAAWKFKGRPACRHGVLFTHLPPGGCKCMDVSSTAEDWCTAVYMPTLDSSLRAIMCTKFNKDKYVRLGVLQAQQRRLNQL